MIFLLLLELWKELKLATNLLLSQNKSLQHRDKNLEIYWEIVDRIFFLYKNENWIWFKLKFLSILANKGQFLFIYIQSKCFLHLRQSSRIISNRIHSSKSFNCQKFHFIPKITPMTIFFTNSVITNKNSPHELLQLKSFIIISDWVYQSTSTQISWEQKQLLIHLSKHAVETQAVTLCSFFGC